MNGGPSQVDTWDYKPELAEARWPGAAGFDNKTGFFPDAVGPADEVAIRLGATRAERHVGERSLSAPRAARGQDGVHPLLLDGVEQPLPALFMMNTGVTRMGYPCVGSWVTYGLGRDGGQPAGVRRDERPAESRPAQRPRANWGAGFLPSVYQGTWLKPQGEPIDNLKPPRVRSPTSASARSSISSRAQPRSNSRSSAVESELTARIESFELAYRMQTAAPEAFDIEQRAGAHQEALRPRPEALRTFRRAMPDGPAHGRARRALRADLFRRHGEPAVMGLPRRPRSAITAASPAKPISPSPACSPTSTSAGC